ncbi:MAG TPA: glycerophosphoryl diester phosphodiesterase membrane domain-containing protein, partial [Dongiaceae bacterium]
LGVLCGTILLIVPGFILAVLWWVAIPVAVVEQVAFGEAFRRSRFLTSGKRWQVFGLLLVIIAIQLLISLVIGFVISFIAGLVAGPGGADIHSLRWIGSIVQVLVGTFTAVTTAVGYYHLRAEKEGVAIGDIAKVFD